MLFIIFYFDLWWYFEKYLHTFLKYPIYCNNVFYLVSDFKLLWKYSNIRLKQIVKH